MNESFERALAMRRGVLGDEYVDAAMGNASAFTAPFQEFATRWAWGEAWLDDTLDPQVRSLLTIGVVAALGQLSEVRLHTRGALRNGCQPEQIGSVLKHVAIYAGIARAVAAVGAADEAIAAHASEMAAHAAADGSPVTAGPAQVESSLVELLTGARVIDLEQPRFPGMPMFPANAPNYAFMLHRRHEEGLESRTSAAGMIMTADHAGTHVDAICHQAENMQMFGGVAVSADNQGPGGVTALSAETLPPMIRRGVLVDLVKARGDRLPSRYLVERDELAATAEGQGVAVRPGDVLLIHTGWGAAWREPDYITGGGMARSSGEWAVEQGVFAVGADNMSWDLPGYTDPVLGHTLPNHTLLLARAGILIFENLLLEELAASGTQEFVFVSLPLKLVGATGSPTRPVAIIPQEGP